MYMDFLARNMELQTDVSRLEAKLNVLNSELEAMGTEIQSAFNSIQSELGKLNSFRDMAIGGLIAMGALAVAAAVWGSYRIFAGPI